MDYGLLDLRIFALLFVIISCNTGTSKNIQHKDLPKNANGIVVTDYSNLFTQEQYKGLTQKIINYEEQTSNEIAILTVDSIPVRFSSIDEYATAIGHYWAVGKADKDNGLIIVLSKNMRKVRISTGYGTEKMLTDSICLDIIDRIFIPHFKRGEFHEGIDQGLDEIMRLW